MSGFTGQLTVTSVDDKCWKIEEGFEFYMCGSYCPEVVGCWQVPKGFVTDFASVPRIFWPIVAPTGRHSKAAALHDLLYSGKYEGVRVNRKEADRIFYEAMRVLKVTSWRARLMWLAVRIFGWRRFND